MALGDQTHVYRLYGKLLHWLRHLPCSREYQTHILHSSVFHTYPISVCDHSLSAEAALLGNSPPNPLIHVVEIIGKESASCWYLQGNIILFMTTVPSKPDIYFFKAYGHHATTWGRVESVCEYGRRNEDRVSKTLVTANLLSLIFLAHRISINIEMGNTFWYLDSDNIEMQQQQQKVKVCQVFVYSH